jgi:hypothetical protein
VRELHVGFSIAFSRRVGVCAYECMLSMSSWPRALGSFFCTNCRSHVASFLLCCDTCSSLERYRSGQSVGAFSSEYHVASKQFPGNLYRFPHNKCEHFALIIGLWLPTACSSQQLLRQFAVYLLSCLLRTADMIPLCTYKKTCT